MRTPMTEARTAPDMVFDVSADGGDDAPRVLMLHGFGVSRLFWNGQVHAAADAGYYAVAQNQRGYARRRPNRSGRSRQLPFGPINDALDIRGRCRVW